MAVHDPYIDRVEFPAVPIGYHYEGVVMPEFPADMGEPITPCRCHGEIFPCFPCTRREMGL
jgi:hypothetical protein